MYKIKVQSKKVVTKIAITQITMLDLSFQKD